MEVDGPPAQRDDASAPFFDGAAREQLMIRRCARCARPEPPEVRTCGVCESAELTWILATGRAHVVTWTVVHRAPHPSLAGAVPYLAGIVELDEGPWLHARILGDPATLRAGLPVEVAYAHPPRDESFPVFVTGS